MQVGLIRAGETKNVTGGVVWEILHGKTFVAALMLGDIVLDECVYST